MKHRITDIFTFLKICLSAYICVYVYTYTPKMPMVLSVELVYTCRERTFRGLSHVCLFCKEPHCQLLLPDCFPEIALWTILEDRLRVSLWNKKYTVQVNKDNVCLWGKVRLLSVRKDLGFLSSAFLCCNITTTHTGAVGPSSCYSVGISAQEPVPNFLILYWWNKLSFTSDLGVSCLPPPL